MCSAGLIAACVTAAGLVAGCDGCGRGLLAQPSDAGGDGAVATCAPQAVFETGCRTCGTAIVRAFWDGVRCFEMDTCACGGEGCDAGFASLAACAAAHAHCDAALCQQTGGVYLPAEPCGPCGDLVCGLPGTDDCCAPGCDCGPGRTFVPGSGCAADVRCTHRDRCVAAGGTWHSEERCISCGPFVCGVVADPGFPCCISGCDCGPHRRFDDAADCVPDPTCDAAPAAICAATGGSWVDACVCFECGVAVAGTDCCARSCDCGPDRSFDPASGCATEQRCFLRGDGEPCTGPARASNCRAGLVCCDDCTDSPCPTCRSPLPCCYGGSPGCSRPCSGQ